MRLPYALLRFGLLGLLLALAACANPTLPAARGPDSPLTVAVPQGALSAALEAAAAEYTRATGETVTVAALDNNLYEDQVSAALLAGLDSYDLVYLIQQSLGKWVGYNSLRTFDAVDPLGLEAWLPALTMHEKLYGLPVQPDVVVIWYRADLLAAAGIAPPRTWAEFRQAALDLQTPERAGAAVAGSDVDAAADFAAVLASFGAQALEVDGDGYRVALESQQAVEALTFYSDPFLAGQVTEEGESLTRADVLAALQEGRAALGIAPLSAASLLRDGAPQLAWTWLPNLAAIEASGSVDAWAMPLHAARPEAAQRFAVWLAGPQGGQVWAQNGGTPAHPAALSAQGAPDAWLALSRVEHLILPLPALSTAPQVWRAYHNAVHAAASGQQTPQAALASGAREMRAALRMGGYSTR